PGLRSSPGRMERDVPAAARGQVGRSVAQTTRRSVAPGGVVRADLPAGAAGRRPARVPAGPDPGDAPRDAVIPSRALVRGGPDRADGPAAVPPLPCAG